MLGNVDVLIALSAFLKRKHLEEGIKTRLEWIPNFVVPPRQGSARKEPNTMPEVKSFVPYFLYVGRLESYKGVHVLIEAYAKKRRRSRLLIVGDGTYSRVLKSQAQNNPNIVFFGQVPPETLEVLYGSALALIVPSLWHENSSSAVLEAASHGTPVIATDNGGLTEVVDGNGAGIIYNEVDELVDALECMEEDPNLRDKLATNALNAYRKFYTPEACLHKYYSLIDSVL